MILHGLSLAVVTLPVRLLEVPPMGVRSTVTATELKTRASGKTKFFIVILFTQKSEYANLNIPKRINYHLYPKLLIKVPSFHLLMFHMLQLSVKTVLDC